MNAQQSETAIMLGIPLSQLDVPELVREVANAIEQRQRKIVAYANVYAFNLAYEQPHIHEFFVRCADIVLCDGFGVKLGGLLIGVNLHHRITSPDWIPTLMRRCVQNEFTVFLLGGREGVAEQAAHNLRKDHPGIKIVGTQHGFFNKLPDHPENRQVIQAINAAHPDILLVAFGMPLQELWLLDNWQEIDAPVAAAIGAALDYIAGAVKRPPRWMTQHGLEWFGRLFIEPRRLWRRYLIGNPLFFWRLLQYRLSIRPAHIQDL